MPARAARALALLAAAAAIGDAASGARAQVPVVGQAYYVRRVVARSGSGCEMGDSEDPGRSTCWTGGRTVCAPLTLDGRTLSFTTHTPGLGRVTVRLVADRAADGRWDVRYPTLSVEEVGVPRRIELAGSCLAHTPLADATLFADLARCAAVPSSFRATCSGPRCVADMTAADALAGDAWTFDDPATRPFVVAGCEQAIAEMSARAALVNHTEYVAAERTFRRFTRVTASGGKLYERHGTVCAEVSVTPAPPPDANRATLFTTRRREPDGVVTRERARYVLRPLIGAATLLELVQVQSLRGQSLGGRGSGGLVPAGLYFGDGLVLLGDRTLYLHRRACSAAR